MVVFLWWFIMETIKNTKKTNKRLGANHSNSPATCVLFYSPKMGDLMTPGQCCQIETCTIESGGFDFRDVPSQVGGFHVSNWKMFITMRVFSPRIGVIRNSWNHHLAILGGSKRRMYESCSPTANLHSLPKGNVIFKPSIFRCCVSFMQGVL